MIKKFMFILVALQLTACTQLQEMAGTLLESGALTEGQIGLGLKEALNVGVSQGTDLLSAKDGYLKSSYKILLPDEVQKVTNKLSGIPGFTAVEGKMIELLNRAAEDAAKSAKPIFVSAIKQMTFTDATDILLGSNNAATNYLQRTTTNQLTNAFKPTVTKSLDRVNATQYWNDVITKYNSIPFVSKVNPNLDDYVTQQALTGLFGMVEKKELGIRKNVSERKTDLLKKVFAKQDS